MRIAIVDDSASLLLRFQEMLQGIPDCESVTFSDPVMGLKWCLANDPDLILVDYVMPELNGIRFIEAIRSDAGRADTPILMVTSCTDKDTLYAALHAGATDFLRKPVDRSEFLARVRNLLKLRRSHRALANRAEWLADEVRKVTQALLDREREAILVLSRAAEYRDTDTHNHLGRMASYCRLLSEGLGLAPDEVDLVYAAAPMHDVGKIGIPDRILLKPGPLDEAELAVMRQHPVIGHRILVGKSRLLIMAAEIALTHHERFDGGGYPYGTAGEAIPLPGRMAALADVFDALTSRRPYKEPWSQKDAYAYVAGNAGGHFDPDCVRVFRERYDAFYAVAATTQPQND